MAKEGYLFVYLEQSNNNGERGKRTGTSLASEFIKATEMFNLFNPHTQFRN